MNLPGMSYLHNSEQRLIHKSIPSPKAGRTPLSLPFAKGENWIPRPRKVGLREVTQH